MIIGDDTFDILNDIHPKTQKAQGIRRLLYCGGFLPGTRGPRDSLTQIGFFPHEDFDHTSVQFPVFARPCPLRPRHGFVESRLVHNMGELKAVWEETLRADTCGELVTMDQLSGKFSFVVNNAGVTWGLGNDGATGIGKHNVTIPAPAQTNAWNKHVTKYSKRYVPPEETLPNWEGCVYVEGVENNGHSVLVQLRDGPEGWATKNYIPKTVKRKTVIYPHYYNLLEWEKKLKGITDKDGLLIHIPGGSLASHYAVHGIAMGISVVTDKELGDIYFPSPKGTSRDFLDYNKLAQQSKKALGFPIPYNHQDVIRTAIASVQIQHLWGLEPHLELLRVLGPIMILRFLLAAGMGEMRYWHTKGPGHRHSKSPKTKLDRNLSRDGHYYSVLGNNRLSLEHMSSMFKALEKDFSTRGWEGDNKERCRKRNCDCHSGNSTYGGNSWAKCMTLGDELARALSWFHEGVNDEKDWAAVILKANSIINATHNTGKVFTKWISEDQFSHITQTPQVGFLSPFVGKLVLGLE